jgi:hypothetical protein
MVAHQCGEGRERLREAETEGTGWDVARAAWRDAANRRRVFGYQDMAAVTDRWKTRRPEVTL